MERRRDVTCFTQSGKALGGDDADAHEEGTTYSLSYIVLASCRRSLLLDHTRQESLCKMASKTLSFPAINDAFGQDFYHSEIIKLRPQSQVHSPDRHIKVIRDLAGDP